MVGVTVFGQTSKLPINHNRTFLATDSVVNHNYLPVPADIRLITYPSPIKESGTITVSGVKVASLALVDHKGETVVKNNRNALLIFRQKGDFTLEVETEEGQILKKDFRLD